MCSENMDLPAEMAKTKRDFKISFNEHKKDFATWAVRSIFSEHILEVELDMQL